MRVLVACEYSGIVREAFRARGHDAYSCDILPAEDASPFHYQTDVFDVIGMGWDMLIAHPPCTYLCNSGVWALYPNSSYDGLVENGVDPIKVEERWRQLDNARAFFMALWAQPIPKICIENPVPHKYGNLPKYTQTIQPYQFGDDASKRTCLWLKGLPKLSIPEESLWAQPRIVDGKKRWGNQTDGGWNKLPPSETRGLERSRTYQGIANAFAAQWG